MRRVALISKPQKAELETIMPELASWLKSRGYEPIFDEQSAIYAHAGSGMHRDELAALQPELVVVLGGDGTLLSAARAFAKTATPILSVNLGSLGFLTEIPIQDLYKALEAWCVNCCEVDQRSMMRAGLCTRRPSQPVAAIQIPEWRRWCDVARYRSSRMLR